MGFGDGIGMVLWGGGGQGGGERDEAGWEEDTIPKIVANSASTRAAAVMMVRVALPWLTNVQRQGKWPLGGRYWPKMRQNGRRGGRLGRGGGVGRRGLVRLVGAG